MTETVKDRIEKQRAGGGSKLEKGELKQRKERGRSQPCGFQYERELGSVFSLVQLILCFCACSFVVHTLFSMAIHALQGEDFFG